ncbi:hypothetical protein [Paraburkholderia unamae]|uniref:hypothetical protein n=1 Tax=Paraburkholderia unamae TaxID=219649 RepID=UPI003CCC89AD
MTLPRRPCSRLARTALAGYQKASGRTLDAKGPTVVAQASIGDFGVSSGADNQALVVVGIRHKF